MAHPPETDSSSLRIIGAGLGRTGTMSLYDALSILGFSPFHMRSIVFDGGCDVAAEWRDILERRTRNAREEKATRKKSRTLTTEEWKRVFAGRDATVDYPGCIFFEELKESFPEAKVILSVRDPESWYESVRKTIASINLDWRVRTSMNCLSFLFPSFRNLHSLVASDVWRAWAFEEVGRGNDVKGGLGDRDLMVDLFNKHRDAVTEAIPEKDLLVFHVMDGWGPLCRFLNVPVPNQPFPHVNAGESFSGRLQGAFVDYAMKCAARDGVWRFLLLVFGVFLCVFLAKLFVSGIANTLFRG